MDNFNEQRADELLGELDEPLQERGTVTRAHQDSVQVAGTFSAPHCSMVSGRDDDERAFDAGCGSKNVWNCSSDREIAHDTALAELDEGRGDCVYDVYGNRRGVGETPRANQPVAVGVAVGRPIVTPNVVNNPQTTVVRPFGDLPRQEAPPVTGVAIGRPINARGPSYPTLPPQQQEMAYRGTPVPIATKPVYPSLADLPEPDFTQQISNAPVIQGRIVTTKTNTTTDTKAPVFDDNTPPVPGAGPAGDEVKSPVVGQYHGGDHPLQELGGQSPPPPPPVSSEGQIDYVEAAARANQLLQGELAKQRKELETFAQHEAKLGLALAGQTEKQKEARRERQEARQQREEERRLRQAERKAAEAKRKSERRIQRIMSGEAPLTQDEAELSDD